MGKGVRSNRKEGTRGKGRPGGIRVRASEKQGKMETNCRWGGFHLDGTLPGRRERKFMLGKAAKARRRRNSKFVPGRGRREKRGYGPARRWRAGIASLPAKREGIQRKLAKKYPTN